MASIYDDWMRGYVEEQEDPPGPGEQAALLLYLNGTTTADEAAREFTKQVAEAENRSAELNWDLLVDVAMKFPQAHQKLLELLDAVEQLLTTEKETTQKSRGEFQTLDGFWHALGDTISGIVGAASRYDSTITDDHHYINLCAFIARYWHHHHEERYTYWAMHQSHDGLEDHRLKPLTNLFGQAVAQLFLFSGPEMYASSNATDLSEYHVGPLLLKERETATVSRWEFWKRRLCQLKESELVTDETRELFSKALESMAKVEAEIGRCYSDT